MTRLISLIVALLATCTLPAAAHAAALPFAGPAMPADLLLTNGHVDTTGGWTQAVAIRGGIIEAVGSSTELAALRGPKTRVIDLKGETVLPGLHDSHAHPIYAGIRARRCKIAQGSNLQTTLARVKACVAKAKPGAWVLGGQWDASALGGVPNRAMLDSVAPDNPVLLEDTSGHSSWANSKALEAAGITRQTPNPEGGIFERDETGQPTGVQRESAAGMLDDIVPKPSEEALQSDLVWALRKMLSFGITSFTEAAAGINAGPGKELQAYAALADRGILKQRVRVCIVWAPEYPRSDWEIASRNFYMRPRVSVDCVKIFLDGVPTDSHTAAMLEPYRGTAAGRDGEAARYGMLLVKPAALDQALIRFDRMGLTVKMHAAGDRAVHEALDAIAAARKADGFNAQMHNVAHNTFVTKADIARAAAIEATFEVSPYLWGPTPINDTIIKAVEPMLIDRVWPVREMLAAGALVVAGSDWSVVPSVNPWAGMEELVTRERPGGSRETFGKGESITLPQAFRLFTANAAQYEGAASRVGRIAPGMLADVIVVERNPFDVPITQVHATRVKMTFIGGELVYRDRPGR